MRSSAGMVAAGIALAVAAMDAHSGTVAIPNTFTPGTPAKAADVNANFNAIATGINGSAADIANLRNAVQALQKAQASGFTFKGPWTSASAYSVNDVVTEAGSSFVALMANTAVDPTSDVNASGGHWALIAAAGAKGATGATGGDRRYRTAGNRWRERRSNLGPHGCYRKQQVLLAPRDLPVLRDPLERPEPPGLRVPSAR